MLKHNYDPFSYENIRLLQIFADFQHIGISVGETAMRATLDTLVKGFDAQLRSWKIEMEVKAF